MSERPPQLEPVRYWPAVSTGDPDLGLFSDPRRTRRRAVRFVVPVVAVLVLFWTAWNATNGERELRVEALVPLIFPIGIAVAGIYLTRPDSRTEGGVWEVDEAGLPVRFVAGKPPRELARDPGVTHMAFLQSVRARRDHD